MSGRVRLIDVLLPEETSSRAVRETVADWRDERAHAPTLILRLAADMRGLLAITRVCAGVTLRGLGVGATWRVVGCVLAIAAAGSMFLVPILWMGSPWGSQAYSPAVWLIPQAMLAVLAPAAALGIGTRAGHSSRVLSAVVVLTILMAGWVGWGVPWANQAYRVAVNRQYVTLFAPRPLPDGISLPIEGPAEMTAGALVKSVAPGRGWDYRNRTAVISQLSIRSALVLAVPTAFVLGVAARGRPFRRWRWRFAQVASAAAVVGLYFLAVGIVASVQTLGARPPIAIDPRGLSIWLWTAFAWLSIAALLRARNREPGTRQANPAP